MKRQVLFRIAMLVVVLSTATALGAIPRMINYQGILTDADGVALEGAHDLTFRVYADSLSGGAIWAETHQGVVLSRGLFGVILGGVSPISDALFASPSLWLGITLDTQPETMPRMRLTSVPWAMKAAVADSARTAGSSSGIIGAGEANHIPVFTGPSTLAASQLSLVADGLQMPYLHIVAAANSNLRACWINGYNNSDALGVYSSTGNIGITGYTNSSTKPAGYFYNLANGATALIGTATDPPWSVLTSGSGIAGIGPAYGVYGKASNISGTRAGGYFSSPFSSTTTYARVAYVNSSGNNYKISGTGAVSTVMPTTKGSVGLIAPESPEAWFQDFGGGAVVNGIGTVQLDATFLECVTIQNNEQLRIFVTFTSPSPETYYVKKTATGFSVVASGANSEQATFDYFVSARWKGWEKVRFDSVDAPPAQVEREFPDPQPMRE
ncbi:MAG: hypothetical protein C4555_01250 [Dehalococcoidia bacterium]|nr:MAG: hypothetical protein C4555_01250 [Dehalococcoidia bacterium]